MTDKHIVYGIVTDCEHYDEVCLGNHHYKWCKDNDKEKEFVQNFALELTNRTLEEREEIGRKYYQQLQAKEKECERLKLIVAHSCHDVWYEDSLRGQLDQLKAENERLQEEREKAKNYNLEYGKLLIKATNKNNKLEQTLTEIKEIAQYDVYTPHTDLCIKLNWVKKKISEVEK